MALFCDAASSTAGADEQAPASAAPGSDTAGAASGSSAADSAKPVVYDLD